MKSYVSDLLELACLILKDVHARCLASDSLELRRDLLKLRRRTEQEGLSFLTITLPSFMTGIERSLEEGVISPTLYRNFGRVGQVPVFLQGVVEILFDRSTGLLLCKEVPP